MTRLFYPMPWAALTVQTIRGELMAAKTALAVTAAAVVLPPAPGSGANHRKLHRLAAAAGAWRCHYCDGALYDGCHDETSVCLIETREEWSTGPVRGEVKPAMIHHAPGVIACTTCITRTVTNRKAAV